jgi:hypothetical protein
LPASLLLPQISAGNNRAGRISLALIRAIHLRFGSRTPPI